jgi:hypothetical protein
VSLPDFLLSDFKGGENEKIKFAKKMKIPVLQSLWVRMVFKTGFPLS